jgi:hypothetical protein
MLNHLTITPRWSRDARELPKQKWCKMTKWLWSYAGFGGDKSFGGSYS